MEKIINLQAFRAKTAFEFAQEGLAEKTKKGDFNYPAIAQELTTLIRVNGLRTSLAFLYSKSDAHKMLFHHVHKWFAEIDPTQMLKADFVKFEDESDPAKKFMKVILNLTDNQYRIVQAEVITLTNWIIRFVKESENKQSQEAQKEGNDDN